MTTKLKLGNSEAALIFRKNGAVEAVLPTVPSDNGLTAQAMFCASLDDELMEMIVDAWRAKRPMDA